MNTDYFPAANYGGKAQLKKLVLHETDYTGISKNKGKAFLIVTVNKDGTVNSVRLFKLSSSEFENEAKRIAGYLKWYPAVQSGEKIGSEILVRLFFNRAAHQKVMKSQGKKMNLANIDTSKKVYLPEELDSLPRPIYPKEKYSNVPQYVVKNFKYPETAIKYAIQGKVKVEFIVEPKGYISNLRIISQLAGGCDVEVARLIDKLYFIPGKKNGKYVRSLEEVEVVIKLPESLMQLR